ncbi:MAG: chorismate mutase, partial [Sinobacteraceae bacterium]|nr:chorismate mutase [Nevskiaceae bacterium]
MARRKRVAAAAKRAAGNRPSEDAPASPLQAPKLEAVRSQIDTIDEQIHALINERARLAQQVGISKTRDG